MKKETARLIWEGGRDGKLLEAICDVVGKSLNVHRTGQNSAGDVVVLGGDRYILSPRLTEEDNQIQGPWEMTYSIGEDGRIAWVWLGHQLLGPCYQRGADGQWSNCYSHGNFGKNCSSGGNWSSTPYGHPEKLKYNTLLDCIEGRKQEIKRAQDDNCSSNKLFLRYAAIPAVDPHLLEI